MALSLSQRLGLTRWGAGTDPLRRAQLDADNAKLDALVAIAQQGLAADRPASGTERRFYYATDTDTLSLDTAGDAGWLDIATWDTGPNGVRLNYAGLNDNTKTPADGPVTYPRGTTFMAAGSTGRPEWGDLAVGGTGAAASYLILTHKRSDAYAEQSAIISGSSSAVGRTYRRVATGATTWSPWEQNLGASGGFLTGELRIGVGGAIRPILGTTDLAAPPSTYPEGLSYCPSSGTPPKGAPTSTGITVTHRYSTSRMVQDWQPITADAARYYPSYRRYGYITDGVDKWSPWQEHAYVGTTTLGLLDNLTAY